MGSKRLILTGALILVVGALVFFATQLRPSHQSGAPKNELRSPINNNFSGAIQPVSSELDEERDVLISKYSNGETKEKQVSVAERSFIKMTNIMLTVVDQNLNKNEFIKMLQDMGLEVTEMQDQQEDISDLSVIRTENSLPGIRHIHGQFEGDDPSAQKLQHLSFEIKKGPQALKKAQELLERVGYLGKLVANTDESMRIYKRDGYVVWIKRLAKEDVLNDPFNAYDPDEDIGNIRVAIEYDIHP